MDEYVSKETLLKAVEKLDRLDKETNTKYEYDKKGYILLIQNAPTADVVEVCRCRDCEYWHKKVFDDIYERYVGECHCPQWENDYFWYETTETDFCSNGKRK